MTGEILEAYHIISKSRNYVGMAGVPLPISISDIELYLSSRPTMIDRAEFDAGIFALDDSWRDGWAREQERAKNKSK